MCQYFFCSCNLSAIICNLSAGRLVVRHLSFVVSTMRYGEPCGHIVHSSHFDHASTATPHLVARLCSLRTFSLLYVALGTVWYIDSIFDPGMGVNGVVYAIALQPDGKIRFNDQ